jgi:hypothetical protein
LNGQFSSLGGVNSTEEAGVDENNVSGDGFCGEESPLRPKDGRAPEVGVPRLAEGLPLQAGGLNGWFSSLGGVKSTEEASVDENNVSDDGFCGEELPLRPEEGRAPGVGKKHFFSPRRRAALSSHRVRRSNSPRRLAALSSNRVRSLYSSL